MTAAGPGSPAIRFSIVTPVCDPTVAELRELWESLLAQTLPAWEWCVCDDASVDPEVVALLDEYSRDARVRLERHPERRGITAASSTAASLATAGLLAFVDHDDRLHPRALADVVETLDAHPDAVLAYTDEDVLDAHGFRVAPSYKPGWSPERLRSQMYVGHLTVVRRDAFDAVGGFRDGFDGSQDYDLALRITERAPVGAVVKVPGDRYHWRATTRSVAGDPDAKPYAYDAAIRALTEHCARVGIEATVTMLDPPGRYVVRRTPARDIAVEVVAGLDDAAALNAAIARSAAEVIVVVDPAAELVADEADLAHVAGLATEDGVGVVGIAGRWSDDTMRDGGLVLAAGGPVGVLADFPHDADHNRGDLAVAREVAAVGSHGFAVSRRQLDRVGGLCGSMALDDAVLDLCCKVRLLGERVVWTPRPWTVADQHRRWEVPSGRRYGRAFRERWLPWVLPDPYYTADIRLGRAHHVAAVDFPD